MSRRRTWLVAGIGAGAALAGAGGALWLERRRQAAEAELAPLWATRLPRPEGGELAFDTLRGRPLLVNFWATWCPPCVRELPLLDRFHREQAGRWQVLGIAVDGPDPVREFLRRSPLGFPVVLAGFEGMTLVRRLGHPGGGLPFSVAIDARGRLRQRQVGELDAATLQRWATSLTA